VDLVLQVLIEIIISPIGGFLRWIVYRKKPLKEYVNDNWEGNLFALSLFFGLIAIFTVVLTNI